MSVRDGAVERNQVMPAMTSAGAHVDDGADFDLALLIASRYRLPPHVARLVVRLAGLGRDGSAAA
jgi:hypothetical protein